MLTQFPIAQRGELLGSILARFITQYRIEDDKAALEWLFGNRKVVPSPLLQGHIKELNQRIGHIWQCPPEKIVSSHTILPLFRPFSPAERYKKIHDNLINGTMNTSSSRTGINAASLIWPKKYQVCPICLNEQKHNLGFYYINRLFQCAGVESCPKHRCLLFKTEITIQSEHRHRFVGLPNTITCKAITPVAAPNQCRLAEFVAEVLDYTGPTFNYQQWSSYYRYLAESKGYMYGHRIDHAKIKRQLLKYWGKGWLKKHGLELEVKQTWLLAIFRKHKRPFTYLQHLAVCLALDENLKSLKEIFSVVSTFSSLQAAKVVNQNRVSQEDIIQYQNAWIKILKDTPNISLKQIRSTKEGMRLYIWLYRHTPEWLAMNKPKRLKYLSNYRVDWKQRDKKLVKALLRIEHKLIYQLTGPRRSKHWYSMQINKLSLIDKKLEKLPLCGLFFDRYSESIEEYQTRRLACVMDHLIENKDYLRPICEIERDAGLSRQRSREPARQILRLDIPAWQSIKVLT